MMTLHASQPELEQHPQNHIVSPVLYVVIFLALMVGTALTVIVSLFNLGPLNPVIALLIAFGKASLVVLFFMHVRWSPRITALAIVAALFFLLIMLSLTSADYISRSWLPA